MRFLCIAFKTCSAGLVAAEKRVENCTPVWSTAYSKCTHCDFKCVTGWYTGAPLWLIIAIFISQHKFSFAKYNYVFNEYIIKWSVPFSRTLTFEVLSTNLIPYGMVYNDSA
jgi:hypothetical protein